jgi:hypothetical protein
VHDHDKEEPVDRCSHQDYPADDPVVRQLGLGAAALRYQQMGLAVVPLVRGGKKPHRMLPEEGGVHWASTYPSAAVDWWSQDPAANVGVATGRPSGLVVVDLDVKRGAQGPASWRDFLGQHSLGGAESVTAATPSGGFHVWYRWPQNWGPVPERPGILPGVDIKGDGGLVVAPPSMSLVVPRRQPGDGPTGEVPMPYYWMGTGCPCQAQQAPGWMPGWLASAPTAGAGTGAAGEVVDDSPDLGKLRKTGVPAGSRNAVLYRLACQRYRVHGTSGAAAVLSELEGVWRAGDTAGMTRSELLTILDSARRFIERQERQEAQLAAAISGWQPRSR